MATFDLEEQEQLSELKLFWQQKGKYILWAIVGVLCVLALWQGWNWHQTRRAAEANTVYATLLDAATTADAAKVKAISAELTSQFPGTTQAALGALIGAKSALDNKDAANAKSLLQSVVDTGRDQGLRDIATVRLAGLLLDEKNYDGALKLLSREVSAAFAPRVLDLKGDVLAASGKPAEARSAWAEALVKIDAEQKGETGNKKSLAGLRDMVVAKLDSLEAAK